jgi:hypothetical protein
MPELLAQIIRNIVEFPDQVKVVPINTERALVMSVSCAPEDIGKVIGREGRIINALRTVVRSAPMRRGSRQRVTVELANVAPPLAPAGADDSPAAETE